MSILVTGGAGYIGSHTCVELLNAGYDIIVLDNFYNSNSQSLKRIKEITKKDFKFYEADIRDSEKLDEIFSKDLTLSQSQKRLGTGLGLFIAKQIVLAHHGKIFIKTKENFGTVISFILPK